MLIYGFDINPFDAVTVQEHRVQGVYGHEPKGQALDQIGSLVTNLIVGAP